MYTALVMLCSALNMVSRKGGLKFNQSNKQVNNIILLAENREDLNCIDASVKQDYS